MITEKDILKYNKWLIDVWNPGQIYIPFLKDVPKAYLDYKTNNDKKDKSIDKVTTTNLTLALRMAGITIDVILLDKIIDLVELIEEKGDDVTIKDITELRNQWIEDYVDNQ